MKGVDSQTEPCNAEVVRELFHEIDVRVSLIPMLHGEGVAIGMALAFEVSSRMGLCSQECPSRVRAHLAAMGMKKDLRDIEGELPDVEGLMAKDGIFAGDPKRILELVHRTHEAGVDNMVISLAPGLASQEHLLTTIDLWGEFIIPEMLKAERVPA